MNRTGNQFLACSAFARNHNCGVLRCNSLDQLEQPANGEPAANDSGVDRNLLLEKSVFGLERFDFAVRFEANGGERRDRGKRFQMGYEPAGLALVNLQNEHAAQSAIEIKRHTNHAGL